MDESMEREFQLMDESVKQGRQDAEEKGAQFVYPDVEGVLRNGVSPCWKRLQISLR